jgi:crossover junction endodeoxyribonuclease RusA
VNALTITLPWPPSGLNPNNAKGSHWGKRAKLAKRYKRDCGWACVAARVRKLGYDRAVLAITFHPPDGARRDIDNMLAAIKAGLDAVSTAIGIDDSRFDLRLARGEPTDGGSVVIAVTRPETEVPAQ